MPNDQRSQVAVPDLQAMKYTDAKTALQGAGLLPQLQQVQGAGQPGDVVGQDPKPGTFVAPGSAVIVKALSPTVA